MNHASEYARAYTDFIKLAVEQHLESHYLLGSVRRSTTAHSGGSVVYSSTDKLQLPMAEIMVEMFIPFDVIRECDRRCHLELVRFFADKQADQFKKHILGYVSQVIGFIASDDASINRDGRKRETSEAEGEVLGAAVAVKLSFDQGRDSESMLQAFRDLELSFDSNGKMILPLSTDKRLVVRLQTLLREPDFRLRFEELIGKKREQYYANRRYRRIPRQA